jgi:hypothetical protein
MEVATINRVSRIAKEIDQLNSVQRLRILSHIVTSIKHEVAPGSVTNLTALQGLGKELWANVDVEDYILNERNAWN